MNRRPNTSGISRYWKSGEDDRVTLAKTLKLRPDDEGNRYLIDFFLSGLLQTVKSRRRTKFVGFGVFEWKRWSNRLPTGRFIDTWRLTFKPARYTKGRYNGK